ncbi:hypothetical protein ITJ42_16040 [Clavibacter michiganensis subsp. phaseoli]|uniref:Uncharacterized protein n=1 Tax=Clavibacter phaseoli TaxID=1734031 RepID=A0A8I0VCQ4_9MICO|nr:hypothetical protein [Clavibacter phaseoli]MBF4632731.1 hypothetical protein [Clavibacter phaseoli]
MEMWALIISIVAAVATAAAAGVAFVQARIAKGARDDARQAQAGSEAAAEESIALSRKATAAFERQAVAQEEANELARASLPPDVVRWEYEPVSGVVYILTNVGARVARGAFIEDIGEPKGLVRPQEDGPRDVVPGDSLEFVIVTAFGAPRPVFRVTWREDGSDEVRSEDTRAVIR